MFALASRNVVSADANVPSFPVDTEVVKHIPEPDSGPKRVSYSAMSPWRAFDRRIEKGASVASALQCRRQSDFLKTPHLRDRKSCRFLQEAAEFEAPGTDIDSRLSKVIADEKILVGIYPVAQSLDGS